jgi:osmotically-inducible protein OsmY
MKQITVVTLALFLVVIMQGCTPAVVGGVVATGAMVAHDRRATGINMEDQNIELKALHLRLQDEELKNHSKVSATSYNLVLLLTGQAETEELRQRNEDIVSTIPSVKRVVNEIEVGSLANMGEKSNDFYITSKVKVKLFNVKLQGFDPTRVKVVTERGSVYLMGLLTEQEADAVVEVVRYVSGVKRVVKVFEYVEPNS